MSAVIGMSAKRQTQKLDLDQYISETLTLIRAIENFYDEQEKWSIKRQDEVMLMEDIKVRATPQGFRKFVIAVIGDSKRQGLEKELGAVLKDTLYGLKKLQPCLEAVEKLAVTSLYAFTDDRHLPTGANAADVRSFIKAARMAAPLVIHFKRDNEAFFLPSLNNVEVLTFHLKKYIDISKQLCEKLKKREKYPSFSENSNGELIQEESIPDHLNQLILLRNDPDLRLTFLFQKAAKTFIDEFSKRHTMMYQFLSDLEETEKKLDNMKFGASISTVAGSSVGVAGGILSIVGLALAPVTAGVSLALTLTGVGLGVTSGVNSLATGIADAVVNSRQKKKADTIFRNFMKDMQVIIELLEEVAEGSIYGSEKEVKADMADKAIVEGVKAAGRVGAIGKGIDSIVDAASAVKVLQSEEVAARAIEVAAQQTKTSRSIPSMAADLPDIGQLAKGTPLALSKAARSGFIALNALFIGLDVFFICKESMSLSKGSKNEFAQIIRSRVDMWRSELESWSRIHESLKIGTKSLKRSQRILNSHFSPSAVY